MDILLLFLTAIIAGAANAVAGGGTFFTFPALTSIGLPALLANATNAVAVSPGHALASFAYRHELARFRRRLVLLGGVSVLGALTGAGLLTLTSENIFSRLVPWLILFATLLFALGPRLQQVLRGQRSIESPVNGNVQMAIYFLASIYGGYFGAGFGIMLMAILTLAGEDDVQIANALKNMIASVVALVTIVFLTWRGLIIWHYAGVMLVGAMMGGLFGGKLARKLPATALRAIVIVTGGILTIYYFVD